MNRSSFRIVFLTLTLLVVLFYAIVSLQKIICITNPRLIPVEGTLNYQIIDDYKRWIKRHGDIVIPYLPDETTEKEWDRVVNQSQITHYRLVPCCVPVSDNLMTLAWANPISHSVMINVDTPYWHNVLNTYEPLNDNLEPATNSNVRNYQAFAFSVLCHENAHLALIEDHDEVYAIQHACENAIKRTFIDRED